MKKSFMKILSNLFKFKYQNNDEEFEEDEEFENDEELEEDEPLENESNNYNIDIQQAQDVIFRERNEYCQRLNAAESRVKELEKQLEEANKKINQFNNTNPDEVVSNSNNEINDDFTMDHVLSLMPRSRYSCDAREYISHIQYRIENAARQGRYQVSIDKDKMRFIMRFDENGKSQDLQDVVEYFTNAGFKVNYDIQYPNCSGPGKYVDFTISWDTYKNQIENIENNN